MTGDTLVSTAGDHVLRASWLAGAATVSVDSAGGTPCDATAVTFGQPYGALCVPSRPGYVFGGWHEEASGAGAEVTATTVVANADDHTLYATWTAATIQVIFDAAGGVAPVPSTRALTFAQAYGELPATTREGHIFGGWWTSPAGGSEVTPATEVSNPADHVLYARWTASRPQVSFDSKGGTACEPRTVTFGQAYGAAGPLCVPTRTGFTFGGWLTADDGTGSAVGDATVVSNPESHVLYARWTARRYTVSFDSDGGTPCDTMSVIFRQTYGPLCEPTRTGWTFEGWFDAPDAGNLITATSIVVIAANHTLYARWTVNTVTVSFDTRGGSSCAPRTVAYGQAYGASGPLCVPARAGYTFGGWFTGVGGTGGVVTGTTPMNRTVSHTLYAGWTAATLTVTYDNGPGAGCGTQSVVHGDPYGPLCTPSRLGHTFGGWMTAPDGSGSTVTATTTVTAVADHTLHARWTADAYVVSFDSQGGTSCAPITVRYGLTYGEGAPGGALCVPTLPGNLFDGWYDTSGARIVATTVVTRTQSHTLQARWKRVPYVVNFDSAGGTTPSPATKSVNYGSLYGALAITSRLGHTFAGWWTEPDGAGDEVTPDTTVRQTSNHTLYAAWTASRFTVRFDAKGGSACADLPVIFGAAYGTAAPGGALCVPVRAGFAFGGWYDADTEAGNPVSGGTVVAIAGDHTLFARWVTNAYTVTFNPQGGTAPSPSATMAVQFGVPYGALPATTRAGYVFSGWWTSPAGQGNQITGTTTVSRAESHTLYAHWVAGSYVVTYDNRGGTGCNTHSVVFGDRYDLRAPLCAPTQTGFVFAGWYLAETFAGDPVVGETLVTTPGAHTLFARWTSVAYVVSFDATGGSACADLTVRYGRPYGEAAPGGALCTPTRSGYVFDGWLDASSNVVTAATTVARAENHTLRARWQAQQYGVTFDAGEGTLASPPGKSVTYGQPYGALAFTSRVGYALSGWRTMPEGGGAEVTADTVVTRAESHTLHAAWTANRYTVSYDVKGGSACAGFEATFGLAYGASAPGGALCLPSRAGHTFGGWFDGEVDGSARVTEASTVVIPGSHTLVARWTANSYTVSFDGGLCASRMVRYGSRYDYLAQTGLTQPLCTPSQSGYRFIQWCLDPACANGAVTGATIVTLAANHTLYPRWEACPAGTYADGSNACAACDPTCATCSGGGANACLSCTSPAFLSGTSCLTCGPDQIRVTYDPQGGTPTPPPDCRTIGQPFGPLASPTKTGNFLTGWFGASAGGQQWTPSTVIPVGSGPMTLYAQWAAGTGQYLVTYNNQGGAECTSLAVRYGERYGLLAPNQQLCRPTRAGYTFEGWYTTASGDGTVVSGATTVTTMADHSLYARWVVTGNELIVWPPVANVRNESSTRFEITALGGSPGNAMMRYCFEIASGPGSVWTYGNVGTYTPPGTSGTNGQQVVVLVWPNDSDEDCNDPGVEKTTVTLTLVNGSIGIDTNTLAADRQYTWTVAVGSKVDLGLAIGTTYASEVAPGFPVVESDADEDGTLSGTLSPVYTAPTTIAGDVAYDVLRWKSPDNFPAGNPTGTNTYVYVRIVKVKQVEIGTQHVCAIDTLGELKCWGDNTQRQLGLEDSATSTVMTPHLRPWVSWQGRRAVKVNAGFEHTCAIFADFSATCWGRDNFGQLGNGAASTVATISNATAINLCAMYTVQNDCLAEPGCAWSAGSCVTTTYALTALSAGNATTCGIRSDGKALCWGRNALGTVGIGNVVDQPSPQLVQFRVGGAATGALLNLRAVSISTNESNYSGHGFNTCAVLEDGSPWCWGSDGATSVSETLGGFGQSTSLPKPVTNKPANRTFKSIVVGYAHTCGLLDDNTVACFGEVVRSSYATPTTQMFTAVSHLSVGAYMNAVVTNGVLRTWGSDQQYSLGDGNMVDKAYSNPDSPNIGATTVLGLSSSGAWYYDTGSTTMVLRQDGRLMCFGANEFNQCATTLSSGSAVDIPNPVFPTL